MTELTEQEYYKVKQAIKNLDSASYADEISNSLSELKFIFNKKIAEDLTEEESRKLRKMAIGDISRRLSNNSIMSNLSSLLPTSAILLIQEALAAMDDYKYQQSLSK